jgi:hypothetical protein
LKSDQKLSRTNGIHPAEIHGFGSWIVLVALFALLVGTMVLAYFESSLAAGVDVPALGKALCLAAFFSILVGVGLTALATAAATSQGRAAGPK